MKKFFSKVKSNIVLFVITISFITNILRVDKESFSTLFKKFQILKTLVEDFEKFLRSNIKKGVDVDEFFNHINTIYNARIRLREVPNNIPALTTLVVITDKFIRTDIIEMLQIVCDNNDCSEINKALENALEEDRRLSLLHKKIFPRLLDF
jgi:hypothetical protein